MQPETSTYTASNVVKEYANKLLSTQVTTMELTDANFSWLIS